MSVPSPGVIDVDQIYSLREFLARTGVGKAGFRTMRRNGLTFYRASGRTFITGRDFANYLDKVSDTPRGGPLRIADEAVSRAGSSVADVA